MSCRYIVVIFYILTFVVCKSGVEPCDSFYDYICTETNASSRWYTPKETNDTAQVTYFDILQDQSQRLLNKTLEKMWQYDACVRYKRLNATVRDKPYVWKRQSEDDEIDVIYALATLTGLHMKHGGRYFLNVDVGKQIDKDSYCFNVYDNHDDSLIQALFNTLGDDITPSDTKFSNKFMSALRSKRNDSAKQINTYEDVHGNWDVKAYVDDYTVYDKFKNNNVTIQFLHRLIDVIYEKGINVSCIHYNGALSYYDTLVRELLRNDADYVETLTLLLYNATYRSNTDCAQDVMYYARTTFNNVYLSLKDYADGFVSKNVKNIVENLRDAMKDIVRESTIIQDESFKAFALDKLDNVKIYVLTDKGDVEESKSNHWPTIVRHKTMRDIQRSTLIVNSGLSPSEFRTYNQPLSYDVIYDNTMVGIVNAWYNPLENTITVPAGIVGWPIYQGNSYGTSDMYDLSKLGMILAHELGHSLDNHGRCFDSKGNYSPSTCLQGKKQHKTLVDDAMTCLAKDYGHPCGINDNYGEKTLGEDIADQLGTRAAFRVFNTKYAAFIRTEDRRDFWRKYASLWCNGAHPSLTTVSKADAPLYVSKDVEKDKQAQCRIVSRDVHALPKHRVDKTLRQLREFSELFRCESTNDMVNSNPCLIY